MVFHAFDGDVLSRFHGLRLQDFREGAFAELSDEAVFYAA